MKPNAETGDIFRVNLNNGSAILGQVIQYDKRGLPGYSLGLFDLPFESHQERTNTNLSFDKCFSILIGTTECFSRNSNWKVIGNQNLIIPKKYYPYERLRKSNKPGCILHNKSAIDEFVNAYYGLLPWDNYYKSDYLDGMLLSLEKKPLNLIYK